MEGTESERLYWKRWTSSWSKELFVMKFTKPPVEVAGMSGVTVLKSSVVSHVVHRDLLELEAAGIVDREPPAIGVPSTPTMVKAVLRPRSEMPRASLTL